MCLLCVNPVKVCYYKYANLEYRAHNGKMVVSIIYKRYDTYKVKLACNILIVHVKR